MCFGQKNSIFHVDKNLYLHYIFLSEISKVFLIVKILEGDLRFADFFTAQP